MRSMNEDLGNKQTNTHLNISYMDKISCFTCMMDASYKKGNLNSLCIWVQFKFKCSQVSMLSILHINALFKCYFCKCENSYLWFLMFSNLGKSKSITFYF